MTAVLFDLFGTLIHLTTNTRPYLHLCRSVDATDQLHESLVIDAPTLADFCDHLEVAHPANLAELQRKLEDDIAAAVSFGDTFASLSNFVDAVFARPSFPI